MKKKLYNIKIIWETTDILAKQIKKSSDSVDVLRQIYDNIEYDEKFYALYLNRSNMAVGYELISIGSVSGTVVDIRKILRGALMANSSNIILSHNHPSGNLTPSDKDKDITKKVIKACKLMELNVLDHIVLTKHDYFSFADQHLI